MKLLLDLNCDMNILASVPVAKLTAWWSITKTSSFDVIFIGGSEMPTRQSILYKDGSHNGYLLRAPFDEKIRKRESK